MCRHDSAINTGILLDHIIQSYCMIVDETQRDLLVGFHIHLLIHMDTRAHQAIQIARLFIFFHRL
jgi:hypothetical protein